MVSEIVTFPLVHPEGEADGVTLGPVLSSFILFEVLAVVLQLSTLSQTFGVRSQVSDVPSVEIVHVGVPPPETMPDWESE